MDAENIEKTTKRDRWATACLICAITLLVTSCILSYNFALYEKTLGLNETYVGFVSIFGVAVFLLTGLNFLLFIGALIAFPFCGNGGRSSKKILGSVFLVLFSWAFICPTLGKITPVHHRILCCSNMGRIGRAFQSFSEKNDGRLPSSEKWADQLMSNDLIQSFFLSYKTSGVSESECFYAFNKHLSEKELTDLPPDIVLLFEVKQSRTEQEYVLENLSGGPDMISTESHKNVGCNIIFVDGSSKFVMIDEIPDLRWQP